MPSDTNDLSGTCTDLYSRHEHRAIPIVKMASLLLANAVGRQEATMELRDSMTEILSRLLFRVTSNWSQKWSLIDS